MGDEMKMDENFFVRISQLLLSFYNMDENHFD
jgi:hypothetical protein